MAPKSRLYWIVCYFILALYGVFTLLPIAYLVVSSFKTQLQIYAGMRTKALSRRIAP